MSALLALVVVAGLIAGGAYLVSPASALKLPKVPQSVSGVLGTAVPSALPEPTLAPTALYDGTRDVAVLMYHDITKRPSVDVDVSTREFARHLAQLKAAGASFIRLSDLYEHMHSGKELPPRAVAFTFDDCYLGQYTDAYPLLKKAGIPATFFIHTSVVGVKTSRDHMTWEQLRALDKEGLVAVEPHTVTHPEDLRKCSDKQLARELQESKRVLEEKLGRKMRFLAYPVGNADGRVARVARESGFEMAFTMGPGWSKSPADAFFVPRFIPTRLPEIIARLKTGDAPPLAQAQVLDVKPMDLETGSLEDGAVRLRWVRGGKLSSARIGTRRDVPTIVGMGAAAAGLNGTFFSDARVNSVGAGIVGPITSRFGPGFAPGLPGDRERIAGRPLVLISPTKMAFLPFQPHLALDADGVERLLPDARDCFLAGAWLVHQGRP
ncbi:MAG TPA: polysaccharide deacetylase family protein, partial [Armatimonadota bacterium]|nr:polysaccharide deacetylase family protein [Armatimonadota bacterium]